MFAEASTQFSTSGGIHSILKEASTVYYTLGIDIVEVSQATLRMRKASTAEGQSLKFSKF